MNWKPVELSPATVGVKFAYTVRSDKNRRTLRFSLCADVLKKMNAKDGSLLRFDVSAGTKQGRLLEVKAGRTARRLTVNELTGRGYFQIPWKGEPEKYMPERTPKGPTELVIDQVTETEGIIFTLP